MNIWTQDVELEVLPLLESEIPFPEEGGGGGKGEEEVFRLEVDYVNHSNFGKFDYKLPLLQILHLLLQRTISQRLKNSLLLSVP